MSDPRNVAHNKKVKQEKAHHQAAAGGDAKVKKGRGKKNSASADQNSQAEAAVPAVEQTPADVEKSIAVLSKLKDLEFHSRANIETLAGLSLTIEDELKQKEFSEAIGAVYSAQDAFQTKIAALIESYAVKCDSLKGTA